MVAMTDEQEHAQPRDDDDGRAQMMTEQQVADELGVSARTLQRWRYYGAAGPAYHVYPTGTVRYDRADVAEWKRRRRAG